jgi:hypothetical protein
MSLYVAVFGKQDSPSTSSGTPRNTTSSSPSWANESSAQSSAWAPLASGLLAHKNTRVARVLSYPSVLTRSVYENMLATGFSNVSNETLGAKPAASGSGGGLVGSGADMAGGVRAKYASEAGRLPGDVTDGGDEVWLGDAGRDGCCLSAERRGWPESREGSEMNVGWSAMAWHDRRVYVWACQRRAGSGPALEYWYGTAS